MLLEVEWVLCGVYELPPSRIIRALAGLPDISLEDAPLVAKAMDWAETSMNFADTHFAAATARLGGIAVQTLS